MSGPIVAHAVEWFADDARHGFRCYACADGPLPEWFPVADDDPQRESEKHIADEAVKEATRRLHAASVGHPDGEGRGPLWTVHAFEDAADDLAPGWQS